MTIKLEAIFNWLDSDGTTAALGRRGFVETAADASSSEENLQETVETESGLGPN